MRQAVLLLVISSQLGIGLGYSANGSDKRIEPERTHTETPKREYESRLDLCAVFGNCGENSGGNNTPGGERGNPPQSVDPQPIPQPNHHKGPDGCTCLCNDTTTVNYDGVAIVDKRNSSDECRDYLQVCCEDPKIVEPIISKPRPTVSTCGIRHFEGITFNNVNSTKGHVNEAHYGEFPWMVAVAQKNHSLSRLHNKDIYIYRCGGSLIHPQVVLTAAHCVRGKVDLLIRAGEWNTLSEQDDLYPIESRNVSEIIVHEQFNSGSLAQFNDLALLILKSPIDMTLGNVGLICLPEPNENMDGRDCVVSGWGRDFGYKSNYSAILNKVEVPMVPRNLCQTALQEYYDESFKLHESFVCAGGQPGSKCCKGDGSPLVCPTQNNPRVYVQAGIVAWGTTYDPETPGVFVNVPYFVNWINDKMQTRNII